MLKRLPESRSNTYALPSADDETSYLLQLLTAIDNTALSCANVYKFLFELTSKILTVLSSDEDIIYFMSSVKITLVIGSVCAFNFLFIDPEINSYM